MKYSDSGVVISVKKYGEKSAILKVFSENYGVYRGFIKYVSSKKNNAILLEIFCEASGRFLVLSTFLSKFLSSKSLIIQPALRVKKAPMVNKIVVKIIFENSTFGLIL